MHNLSTEVSIYAWAGTIIGIALITIIVRMAIRTSAMNNLPIAVGDFATQQRFIKTNAVFLLQCPKLRELYDRVFLRSLKLPDEAQREPLLQLPEDDPAVIAFEDKMMADLAVFYLGRAAVDDFGELLVVGGNGYGFGAYKILRGMYERTVTAMYLAKHPDEARNFAESSAIMKRNYLKRAQAVPETVGQVSAETMQKVEENAAAVQGQAQTVDLLKMPPADHARGMDAGQHGCDGK